MKRVEVEKERGRGAKRREEEERGERNRDAAGEVGPSYPLDFCTLTLRHLRGRFVVYITLHVLHASSMLLIQDQSVASPVQGSHDRS